jgi:hypothetical protein
MMKIIRRATVLVSALGLAGLYGCKEGQDAAETARQTATVSRRNINRQIQATGVLFFLNLFRRRWL